MRFPLYTRLLIGIIGIGVKLMPPCRDAMTLLGQRVWHTLSRHLVNQINVCMQAVIWHFFSLFYVFVSFCRWGLRACKQEQPQLVMFMVLKKKKQKKKGKEQKNNQSWYYSCCIQNAITPALIRKILGYSQRTIVLQSTCAVLQEHQLSTLICSWSTYMKKFWLILWLGDKVGLIHRFLCALIVLEHHVHGEY